MSTSLVIPETKDGQELLAIVERTVPQWLPYEIRDDVIQDVLIDFLEKRVEAELPELIKKATRRAYRFRDNHHMVSLEAPLGTGTQTWADRITDENLISPNPRKPERVPTVLPVTIQRYSKMGRPRTAIFVRQLEIFLGHHSQEKCGKPYTKFQHPAGSFHANCPRCAGLMHPAGGHGYQNGSATGWRWRCSLCFTYVVMCEEEGLRKFSAQELYDLQVRQEKDRHKYELRRLKAQYWLALLSQGTEGKTDEKRELGV